MNRVSFSKALFDHLNQSQAEYLLVKHLAASLDEHDTHSDFDILMPGGVSPSLKKFMSARPEVEFVRWQTWADRTAAFVFLKNGGFVQVDFLSRLARKSLVYIPNRFALANKKRNTEGIVVASNRLVLEHAVLFNFLNFNGLPAKYLDFFEKLHEKEQEELVEQFNFKYQTSLTSLSEFASFSENIRQAILNYAKNQPENNFWARLSRRMSYLRDVVGHFGGFPGAVITFSGVDGAGKSTILEALRRRLEDEYRQNVVVLRHRPGLLPILSAWTKGRRRAELEAAATLPHSGKNSSPWAASLRFLYYFLDYLIGQFWVWARWQSRGKIVLYDRYYFDFMADPRRSNAAQLPAWLTRLGLKFIRQPDLNVFLYASPEVILARKRELNASAIEQVTKNYRNLFDHLDHRKPGAYLQLENTEMDNSINLILKRFRDLQAA